MSLPLDPVERYYRLYLGIAVTSFSRSAVSQDPDVATIYRAWYGLNHTQLMPEALNTTFQFAESEFYERTREIAETAAQIQKIPEFHFNFMRIANFDLSVQRIDQRPVIFLDQEFLDFWFGFFFARLCEIHAAKSIAERRELDRISLDQILHFAHRRRVPDHERSNLTTWFTAHQDIAAVAASLSRVIAYYVIAHEIAHVALHEADNGEIRKRELEADYFAARTLIALRRRPDLQWASVPDAYLAAPVIFCQLLNVVELAQKFVLGRRVDRRGYPSPRERRTAVSRHTIAATPNDKAFCIDMRHSLARLSVSILRQSKRVE